MGVSLGVNLSKGSPSADASFGGLPAALSEAADLGETVDQADALMRKQRAERESMAAAEQARASGRMTWEDAEGTLWTYVALDGSELRIESCSTQVEHLVVPDEIAGLPVAALASDACANLPSVVELVCPDSVRFIGFCAFRGCRSLKKAVLPAKVSSYDSGWFRSCPNLEELTLPGGLRRLTPGIFDAPNLKALRIGRATCELEPGAFGKSRLERIEVAAENPFIKTDGAALYSKDGSRLLALAVPLEEYRIAEGCYVVERKAFGFFGCLRKVVAPNTLEVIRAFAFARTGIGAFSGPPSLRHVEEKAFFNCENLRHATFAEGLVSLGPNALSGTGVSELRLPSTLRELGSPLAEGTSLVFSGPRASFGIARGEGAGSLELDEDGGLYRRDEDGLAFVLLLDPLASTYRLRPGVLRVCGGAFAGHAHLAEVVLPEGLREIEAAAFKGCRALREAGIPGSVRFIGDEAFLDTNLESACLPAGLEHLGANALVTQGAHYSASIRANRVRPSLRELRVAEGNKRFLMEGGLLLERAASGRSMRVLLCLDGTEVVRVPREVNEIAPYAFNNVRGIRELRLSDRIVVVGIRGLAVDGFIELIHVDLAKEQKGRGFFELRFPETDRGIQQMMLALSVPDHVSVETLFGHYDTAITNGSSFDAAAERGLDLYEQTTRLVQRLLDPVYLTEVNRQLCERFLRENAERACVELAKHDDREALEAMLDLGFLNVDNIYAVIDRVGALQDAAIVNYLLEARRVRFGQSIFDDFEL